MNGRLVHETTHRLRIAVADAQDLDAVAAQVQALPGVASVRANRTVRCLVVRHEGSRAGRDAILQAAGVGPAEPGERREGRAAAGGLQFWLPGALAAAVPLLPADWRKGGAVVAVGARVAVQGRRLREDPAAVLLDTAALAGLAAGGQALAVSASILLRLWSEGASQRLVRQSDALLQQLLPTEAAQYRVAGEAGAPWLALADVRVGDRLLIGPGDVVPVDGSVAEGSARVALPSASAARVSVGPGDHLAAGSRVVDGTMTLHAEATAAGSRLERIRGQLRFALESHEPPGPPGAQLHRMVSLPVTAAAVVLGLTGDSTRAATMLGADPQQGLDLARPVAREAALYALARAGLLTGGLLAMERVAAARVLVLQDTGILGTGRWTIEAIESDLPHDEVAGWLTALARTTPETAAHAGFSDATVREWVRHGALLVKPDAELHLASPRRLLETWGLRLPEPARPAAMLRRELAVVRGGRVVARVTLASALRAEAVAQIAALRELGLERIAVFEEDAGEMRAAGIPGWAKEAQVEVVGWRREDRTAWIGQAAGGREPLLFVHTVLRDLLPAGSVSLTPTEGDAGSHGVLLDDPLRTLVRARGLAAQVRRRLRRQRNAAELLNAALMTASALRWLPPMASVLVHHGFALALLLDSHRLEGLAAPAEADPDGGEA